MTAERVTVVFIHAIAGSPTQWAAQIDALGSDYEVVAVTLPGHVGTDGLDRYTIDALAEAVLAQIEGRERIVLVGHSGGSLVAAHLAATHPDRVAGLLLVDPGTDGRASPAEMAAPMLAALRSEAYPAASEQHWLSILDGATEATRDRALADLRAAAPAVLPDFLEDMGTYDAVTPIREVAASRPVVAILTPLSEGPDALVSDADGVEVVRVEGTSHWVQLDRPEAVNNALARLFTRAESD